MRISGSVTLKLSVRRNCKTDPSHSVSNPLDLFSNMGNSSQDEKKGGSQRRVLASIDNLHVSGRSKKIKKKLKKEEAKKAKEDRIKKYAEGDEKKNDLIKEWENKNSTLLTSGIPIVYVDGACKNNDLFKKARENGYTLSEDERLTVKASYGIYWGENHPLNQSRRLPYMKQTNNRAELAAAIAAMKQAIEQKLPGLIIFSDSEYVVKMYNIWLEDWKENNWRRKTGERIINLDLVKKLDRLREKIDAEIAHVPGHIGVPGNHKAHKLAHDAFKKNLLHEHPDVWPKDA